jgi:glycosyltransferase involved in cell wall biosynthesis
MLEFAPPAATRLCVRFDDALRTRHASAALATLQAPRAFLARDPTIRLRAAAALARAYPELGIARGAVAQAIATARSNLDRFPEKETTEIIRSAVIKSPCGPHERGVLLVAFESGLAKVLGLRRFPALEDAYKIVFIPSWHPFFTDTVLLLAARARRAFGLMPSLFSEEPLCEQLGPLCDFLPFHAASWVNPDLYPPAATKPIDLLMLANFTRIKRHWRLFEALPRLPPTYRVVLIGGPRGGRDEHDVRREARAFGVEDRIEIVVDPSQEVIRRMLAEAKLFCALSHKEGSYIAVAEALIAGAPVAAFANARFGTKAHINRKTGVLLDPKRDLAVQLRDAVERHDQFAAAKWARENISARVNCAKLDGVLAAQATPRGEAWTRSIKSFYRKRFEFHYYDAAEAEAELADDYQRIRQDFGLTIVRPPEGRVRRQ